MVRSTMRKRGPPRVAMKSSPGWDMSQSTMRAMLPMAWGTAASPTSAPSRIRHTPKGVLAFMQRAAMSR